MTEGGSPRLARYSHAGESEPEPPSAFGISPRRAGGEGIGLFRALLSLESAGFLHLRHVVRSAVSGICERTGPRDTRSYVVPAGMHPGLQIADYCCWAIQRKWEHGKLDAYRRIAANISSESVFFEER